MPGYMEAHAGFNDEGYFVDENGHEWGWCNSCGDEAPANTTCCIDGEVVPYDDEDGEEK